MSRAEDDKKFPCWESGTQARQLRLHGVLYLWCGGHDFELKLPYPKNFIQSWYAW